MASGHEQAPVSANQLRMFGGVRNIGEPLRFSKVEQLVGFSGEASQGGSQIKVWTNLAVTSYDPLFHRLLESLANSIRHMAQQNGVGVALHRADTILLVLKPDASAELWLDTAAVSLRCSVKRAVAAGAMVFEQDISDITGMTFPCVAFEAGDKVLCVFRQDWSFGFAFDMNPEGKLDVERFTMTLGSLYRELRYKHLYDALNEPRLFGKLLTSGWFPFVEIMTVEFTELLRSCEAEFDLSDVENQIVAKFDEARMQRLLVRWIAKPHFARKADLLKAAISAFSNKEPIAVLKILLSEIEGVLNDAYRTAHGGQGAKLKDLLVYVETSAEQKSGSSNTLLFPKAFGQYLREHTFANFDPVTQSGNAGSRHAVSHGAASQDSYTMTRALQSILTLDQLAFYT